MNIEFEKNPLSRNTTELTVLLSRFEYELMREGHIPRSEASQNLRHLCRLCQILPEPRHEMPRRMTRPLVELDGDDEIVVKDGLGTIALLHDLREATLEIDVPVDQADDIKLLLS